jgi:hypothetical protein
MAWIYSGAMVTLPVADLELILRDRAEWIASAQWQPGE